MPAPNGLGMDDETVPLRLAKPRTHDGVPVGVAIMMATTDSYG